MTCPIAHYADLPGYTQADVEAACRLARAVNALNYVLDAEGPTAADRATAMDVYNTVCRKALSMNSRTVMFLTFRHHKSTTTPSRPSSPPAAGTGGGR